MHPAILLTPLMLTLAMLASCSSPPRPPTVDESGKRPANSATAVELQICRHDLQNTRLVATESGRQAEATAAALNTLAARQQLFAAMRAADDRPKGNKVYIVRFGFGSTAVDIPADLAQRLIDDAKAAPLVTLRGRTDGVTNLPAEDRIARQRAIAVRDYLVAAGVGPSNIRATYQPTGDHLADNTDASGRVLNRRVEIEVYRSLPSTQTRQRTVRLRTVTLVCGVAVDSAMSSQVCDRWSRRSVLLTPDSGEGIS